MPLRYVRDTLAVTIGRTYEWYEVMGEFEDIRKQLEVNSVCKGCDRTRYCEWPGVVVREETSQ
jgi:hypothetical protein